MAISDLPAFSPFGFVSVWLKGATPFPSATQTSTILCCYDDNTDAPIYFQKSLDISLIPYSGQSGRIQITFSHSLDNIVTSNPTSILDGNWHHIMISWDLGGQLIDIFVDNDQLNHIDNSDIFFPSAIRCGGRSWIVGNSPEFNSTQDSEFDQGYYGSMAWLFVLMDNYIDITDDTIRAKFIVPAPIA